MDVKFNHAHKMEKVLHLLHEIQTRAVKQQYTTIVVCRNLN
jgi:hypothetical protein